MSGEEGWFGVLGREPGETIDGGRSAAALRSEQFSDWDT